MGDVVIDTDVASVLQKGRAPGWVNRHLVGQRVWLTFVTVAELWKWAEARSWGAGTRGELASWLSHRPVIPSDEDVAKTWARLAAQAQRRGRPRPQNDTWIAACCVRHDLPLVTLNNKGLRGLRPLRRLDPAGRMTSRRKGRFTSSGA